VKLLALTTATPRCSVAVLDNETVLAVDGYEDGKAHAERLFSVIDAVITTSGCDRAQLQAVCCDVGPGSFTGVRVGVASAKGIAVGLGLPMVAVLSLEAMAAAAFAQPELATNTLAAACLLDAKRNEHFMAVYGPAGKQLLPPQCVATDALREAVIACGVAPRALLLCGEAFDGLQGEQPGGLAEARLARADGCAVPDARWIGRCGLRHLVAGRRDELASIEPVYVRPPDAKLPALPPDRHRQDAESS